MALHCSFCICCAHIASPYLEPSAVVLPQLDQVGHPFYVFLNAESHQVQVVYRRKEEGYGVIIPHVLSNPSG